MTKHSKRREINKMSKRELPANEQHCETRRFEERLSFSSAAFCRRPSFIFWLLDVLFPFAIEASCLIFSHFSIY